MFLRVMLGNAVFAGIIWGYWAYAGGNRAEFVRGAILISIAFVSGVVIGAWLNRSMPNRVQKSGKRIVPNVTAFDQIQ